MAFDIFGTEERTPFKLQSNYLRIVYLAVLIHKCASYSHLADAQNITDNGNIRSAYDDRFDSRNPELRISQSFPGRTFDMDDRFIPGLTKDCVKLLQDYATITSEFVYCTLISAKPLNFCEMCVGHYERALGMYSDIEMTDACNDPILRSDRVQVIGDTHIFIKQLWTKGSCQNCFMDSKHCLVVQNTSAGCSMGTTVQHFLQYNNQTLNCFQQAKLNDADACKQCSSNYTKQTKLYESMGEVEEICGDCVEQMNSTRKLWSLGFNCTNTHRDIAAVLSVSTVICSLPLFFYVISYIHAVKTEYKLMKVSRLEERNRIESPRLKVRTIGQDNSRTSLI